MSEDWNRNMARAGFGTIPPTLEEAIFAASGITENQDEQAEIAAS